jgi:hypothetical protein
MLFLRALEIENSYLERHFSSRFSLRLDINVAAFWHADFYVTVFWDLHTVPVPGYSTYLLAFVSTRREPVVREKWFRHLNFHLVRTVLTTTFVRK